MNAFDSAQNLSVKINGIYFHIHSSKFPPFRHEEVIQKLHMHYTWEFQYIFKGTQEIYIDQQKEPIILGENQLCMIPPETIHRVNSPAVTRICFNITLDFDPKDPYGNISDYYRLHSVFTSIKDVKIVSDPYVVSLMERFQAGDMNDHYPNLIKGSILCTIIMCAFHIIDSTAAPQKSGKEKHLNTDLQSDRQWIIEAHITKYFTEESGLSVLAKQLRLSERQTRVTVKELMGENYKKLIIKHRMEIANSLISSPSISLSDIALQIGYRSYNGFYLAYTKYYGVTPEAARKKAMEKQVDPNDIDWKIYVKS